MGRWHKSHRIYLFSVYAIQRYKDVRMSRSCHRLGAYYTGNDSPYCKWRYVINDCWLSLPTTMQWIRTLELIAWLFLISAWIYDLMPLSLNLYLLVLDNFSSVTWHQIIFLWSALRRAQFQPVIANSIENVDHVLSLFVLGISVIPPIYTLLILMALYI